MKALILSKVAVRCNSKSSGHSLSMVIFYYSQTKMFCYCLFLMVHPQNVQLHNVQLQNVQLPNVQLQNVQDTKRPGYKTSRIQNVQLPNVQLQNVQDTKRPGHKTSSFCKFRNLF
jgi:hypothetical protein